MPLFKSKAESSGPRAVYRIANYDGSNSAHPHPEESGELRLTSDGYWVLSFDTTQLGGYKIRGSLRRFPLVPTSTGPNSSSVIAHFALDLSKKPRLSFELPDTSATEIDADLQARGNGNWSAEDEDKSRLEQIDSKYSVTFSAVYLGGLPRAPQRDSYRRTLAFRAAGMSYESSYYPSEKVCCWDEVQNIDIEGGEVAKSKVGATLAFGIWGGLAAKGAKDRTYVLLKLKDGSEGIWEIDK